MFVFVKIVKKEGKQLINRLYPACDVIYLKKESCDRDSFFENEKGEVLFAPEKEKFEYVCLTFKDPQTGEQKNILAPECTTYILNSNGKTVDSIHCR